jgi:hypothetical protein
MTDSARSEPCLSLISWLPKFVFGPLCYKNAPFASSGLFDVGRTGFVSILNAQTSATGRQASGAASPTIRPLIRRACDLVHSLP